MSSIIENNRQLLINTIKHVVESAFKYSKGKGVIYEIYKTICNNSNKDYLSFPENCKGKISYAKNQDHKFDEKYRIKTTLSRYIRRQLKKSSDLIDDQTLDLFSKEVMKMVDPLEETKINIHVGEAVRGYYSKSLIQSCMTGYHSDYTELYVLNSDKVKMMVFGEGASRALCWTCDDGVTVLDRIYPVNGSLFNAKIKLWAKNKGYIVRDENKDKLLSDGKIHSVTLKCRYRFPYLDTFRYGTFNEDKSIVVLTNGFEQGMHRFTSTDGRVFISQKCGFADCKKYFYLGSDCVYNMKGNVDVLICENCYYSYKSLCKICGKILYNSIDCLCNACRPKPKVQL